MNVTEESKMWIMIALYLLTKKAAPSFLAAQEIPCIFKPKIW